MSDVVLDASAILAVLYREPGELVIRGLLEDPSITVAVSSVNLCEVATKIVQLKATREQVASALEPFQAYVVPFTAEHAADAAGLVRSTREAGLSLGDRACLALAGTLGATAWTADHAWTSLKLPIPIKVIRD